MVFLLRTIYLIVGILSFTFFLKSKEKDTCEGCKVGSIVSTVISVLGFFFPYQVLSLTLLTVLFNYVNEKLKK